MGLSVDCPKNGICAITGCLSDPDRRRGEEEPCDFKDLSCKSGQNCFVECPSNTCPALDDALKCIGPSECYFDCTGNACPQTSSRFIPGLKPPPTVINDTNIPFVQTFTDDSPDFSFIPRDGCQIARPEFTVSIGFGHLEAIDMDGNVVGSLQIPNGGGIYAVSGVLTDPTARVYNLLDKSKVELELAFSYLPALSEQSFANFSYTVPRSSAKWTVSVPSRPQLLAEESQQLRLLMHIGTEAALFGFAERSEDSFVIYDLQLSPVMTMELRLIDFALIDGERQEIEIEYQEEDGTLTMLFPFFNQSLEYDPDLSVLLVTGSEGGDNADCGGDSDGGGDDDIIPLWLAISAPILGCCLAAAVVVFILLGLGLLYIRAKMTPEFRETRDTVLF
eukprot:TRINITY_DN1748_c0_g1_i1.p1 TRINITY_DN1748_c0_g1~~TRINITY_DN1748_c0_g1_i1.p1  ORF type:complete len:435 (-),score=70.71 TRINITY_DN1748_c0_g1_i1:194-1366(-)